MTSAKSQLTALLAEAGIAINGPAAWDMQVRDERLYACVWTGGSLALGKAYMNGWFDVAALDQFFCKILSAKLDEKIRLSFPVVATFLKSVLFNLQNSRRAFEIGVKHYDVGNDLYEAMLDRRMTYTCGYWQNAKNLDEAQEHKLDLVCRKIGLKPGDHVLDIGCGWGSFLKFAAETCGAQGSGLTVSKEQLSLGQKRCAGLPVTIELKDYRRAEGSFDHVVSLGMFEHVGCKNYRTYLQTVSRLLKDDGFFLLQTIGSNRSGRPMDPWMAKYIFPNSMLPSIAQIGKSIEGLFVMEDWHNFGADYDKTLMAWFENFDRAWPLLKQSYSERFYRMWKYYLLSCAGAFRARHIQLWQIVLSKKGVPGGYRSMRPG